MFQSYADRTETMRDALERAIATLTRPTVTLRELLSVIGDHGPLLMCAMLTIPFLIPVSIPGVSTIFGLAILLLAIGITFNRAPWLPARIMDRAVDAQTLKRVLERGVKLILRIEAVISQRIEVLTAGSFAGCVNGLAIVAGALLLMMPLGLIPFSNTLPAFAILFLSIGMAQRDGLLVLAGYGALLATCIYFSMLAYAAFAAGHGLMSIFGE